MTETTQETIKFARNWLENGIEDEPSPVTVHELAKAVVELADEIEAMTCTGDCVYNCNCIKAIELNKELAALKEKYRWRKQSEEPAPEDEVVEAIYLCENRYCGAFYANRYGSELKSCDYWRPLDLPEESK